MACRACRRSHRLAAAGWGHLHLGDLRALEADHHVVIEVVGVPDLAMAGLNVLLLENKKDTHFNCLNKQHSLNCGDEKIA